MISKSEIKALAEADEQEVVAEVQVSLRWDLSGYLHLCIRSPLWLSNSDYILMNLSLVVENEGGGMSLAEVTFVSHANFWKGENMWLQL